MIGVKISITPAVQLLSITSCGIELRLPYVRDNLSADLDPFIDAVARLNALSSEDLKQAIHGLISLRKHCDLEITDAR